MLKRIVGAAGIVCLIFTTGGAGPGYNLPPADRLAAPGPGIGGPGPGVLTAREMSMMSAPTAQQAFGGAACGGPGAGGIPSAQVLFAKPAGMQVYWDVTGNGQFGATPLVTPGRTNFRQAGLYRLKVTNIVDHEGVELYPTLEVGPFNPRTQSFLSHNTIPIQLTVSDISQVLSGNFVTKAIYLPDPEFQELAVANVETLVSTRLDPGIDPIDEADRRGVILAVLRVGNIDREMPSADLQPPVSTVAPAGYFGAAGPANVAGPAGMAGGFGPAGTGGYIAGINAPPYGMPITGTPIGLPGPPHIPMGTPAGLQKHVMYNHTPTYVPNPARDVKIHVKQHPGLHYPQPRTRAWINEYNHPNCGHGVGTQQCASAGCCP